MNSPTMSDQKSNGEFYSNRLKKSILYFSITFSVSFVANIYRGSSIAEAIWTSVIFAGVFAAVIWYVWIEG